MYSVTSQGLNECKAACIDANFPCRALFFKHPYCNLYDKFEVEIEVITKPIQASDLEITIYSKNKCIKEANDEITNKINYSKFNKTELINLLLQRDRDLKTKELEIENKIDERKTLDNNIKTLQDNVSNLQGFIEQLNKTIKDFKAQIKNKTQENKLDKDMFIDNLRSAHRNYRKNLQKHCQFCRKIKSFESNCQNHTTENKIK